MTQIHKVSIILDGVSKGLGDRISDEINSDFEDQFPPMLDVEKGRTEKEIYEAHYKLFYDYERLGDRKCREFYKDNPHLLSKERVAFNVLISFQRYLTTRRLNANFSHEININNIVVNNTSLLKDHVVRLEGEIRTRRMEFSLHNLTLNGLMLKDNTDIIVVKAEEIYEESAVISVKSEDIRDNTDTIIIEARKKFQGCYMDSHIAGTTGSSFCHTYYRKYSGEIHGSNRKSNRN